MFDLTLVSISISSYWRFFISMLTKVYDMRHAQARSLIVADVIACCQICTTVSYSSSFLLVGSLLDGWTLEGTWASVTS